MTQHLSKPIPPETQIVHESGLFQKQQIDPTKVIRTEPKMIREGGEKICFDWDIDLPWLFIGIATIGFVISLFYI